MKSVNCVRCGKSVDVENDFSDLFADSGPAPITCDECYRKIQESGRAAAKKVADESREYLASDE